MTSSGRRAVDLPSLKRGEIRDPALTAALRGYVFAADARVPEMEWKTSPTTGILAGTVVVRDGSAADQVDLVIHPIGRTSGERIVLRTDGTGWFAAVDLAPGRYRVEVVEASATGTASTIVRVDAGEITEASVRAR